MKVLEAQSDDLLWHNFGDGLRLAGATTSLLNLRALAYCREYPKASSHAIDAAYRQWLKLPVEQRTARVSLFEVKYNKMTEHQRASAVAAARFRLGIVGVK